MDEILELDPGRQIRACRHVSPDEDYFLDHFPGFPVVPGVILTEMMGQAAGKCLAAESLERGRPMLAQIKSAKFREWVAPGKTVILTADIRTSRPQFATAECRAEVDGREVCSAELLFTFVSPEKFGISMDDEVLQRYLEREGKSQGKV